MRKFLRIRGAKPTREQRAIILAHAGLGNEFIIIENMVHAVCSDGLVCIKPNKS